MPIGYMVTKRQIAHRVRTIVEGLEPNRRVLELFSGLGAVAGSLSGYSSVMTDDAAGPTCSGKRG